jgi:hypothetical protein
VLLAGAARDATRPRRRDFILLEYGSEMKFQVVTIPCIKAEASICNGMSDYLKIDATKELRRFQTWKKERMSNVVERRKFTAVLTLHFARKSL